MARSVAQGGRTAHTRDLASPLFHARRSQYPLAQFPTSEGVGTKFCVDNQQPIAAESSRDNREQWEAAHHNYDQLSAA